LAGLPLAIELAAARVRALPLRGLLARLPHQLDVLAASRPGMPARQQTMRAALDWSYQLLDEATRRLFAVLSLFAVGAPLEAVAGAAGMDEVEALDLLERLIDASLVRMDERADAARYEMLEPIRQFARERLDDSGDAEAGKRQLLRWYATRARNAVQGMEQLWQRFAYDVPNLLLLLRYAAETDDWASGVELSYWLGEVFYQGGERNELFRFAGEARSHLLGDRLHEGMALIIRARTIPVDDPALAEEAVQRLQRADAPHLLGEALFLRAQGMISLEGRRLSEKDLRQVEDDLNQARRLVEPDSIVEAMILVWRAVLAPSHARRDLYARAVEIADRRSDTLWKAYALNSWAWMSYLDGDFDQSTERAEQALEVLGSTRMGAMEVATRHTAALAQLLNHQPEAAATQLRRIAELFLTGAAPTGADAVWDTYHAAAAVAAAYDELSLTAQLVGVADERLEKSGASAANLEGVEHYQPMLDEARTDLGERPWNTAYRQGRMLSDQAALTLVKHLGHSPEEPMAD
jgi:hypothetical protein